MNTPNPHFQSSAALQADMRLKRLATAASMSVATILIITKVTAFLMTNSVSLLSSLMDSFFDLLASLVTLLGVIHAASPADEDHRYGHGKLEALAALAQAVFVVGSSLFLIVESVRRFITPEAVKDAEIGVGVMLLSIILTGLLITFQKYVVHKTKSVAISADRLHYTGDLLMNAAVIAALLLAQYTGWSYFDPIFALLIAAVLLRGAWSILMSSSDILMDKELPEEDRRKIEAIATSHPHVESIHDLRTRSTGNHVFIEFHVEMDGSMTLDRAHDITEELEKKLYAAFPKSEILMHQEPAGIDDHRLDHRIQPSETGGK
jgi:ferrous-iron efflux pump FieF